MSAPSSVTTFDAMLKGLFPERREDMPEWARKSWAERADLERNGPRVAVEPHLDNTGMPCREAGPASLVHDLFWHDCCSICGDRASALARIGMMFAPLHRRTTEGA